MTDKQLFHSAFSVADFRKHRLAELAKVSRQTIYDWEKSIRETGELPSQFSKFTLERIVQVSLATATEA